VDPLNVRVNFPSNRRKSVCSAGVKAASTRALARCAGPASWESSLLPDRVSRKRCRRRSCSPTDRTTRPSCSNFLSTIPVVERSRPNRLATEIWSMPGRCSSTNRIPYCLLVTPSFPVSSTNNDTAIWCMRRIMKPGRRYNSSNGSFGDVAISASRSSSRAPSRGLAPGPENSVDETPTLFRRLRDSIHCQARLSTVFS
jgi:hypothetical protein